MKRETKRKLVLGGCVAAAAIFIAALVWGPWLLEGHHVRDSKLAPSAGIIITGFRTMLVALAAGAIAGLGLYYTHRNHKHAEMLYAHSQEQFAHARRTDKEQADLAREGHVTGRYVEASKLLASENPTERLCGIYAFERIMRDSERDHQTVVEVLAAFIRQGAQEERPDGRDVDTSRPERAVEDVIAAFTVLGRRPNRTEAFRTDLKITDLRGAHLTGANLHRANLEGARMQSVVLKEANLHRASIAGANLERADLTEANLHDVDAVSANLRHANLREANLHRALLQAVNLEGADLREVNLHDAVLDRADLLDANLRGASFVGTQMVQVRHVTVEQLVLANLYNSTALPEYLAADMRVQARIRECEEERRDGT
ncbi:pentapeptide repeat-containing protein [Streptomyces sp. wa22]|uniref:pentapeptide repeat-containing protein n=1 Tax=Streptomyces sp. wa22 TaxID=1828244 RepID=UPI00164FF7D5|nr:pentapeptide repeat-containing protein [Streptomyces sp. wa22]